MCQFNKINNFYLFFIVNNLLLFFNYFFSDFIILFFRSPDKYSNVLDRGESRGARERVGLDKVFASKCQTDTFQIYIDQRMIFIDRVCSPNPITTIPAKRID